MGDGEPHRPEPGLGEAGAQGALVLAPPDGLGVGVGHAQRAADFRGRFDQRLVIGEHPVRGLLPGHPEQFLRVVRIYAMKAFDIRLLPGDLAPFDEDYVDALTDRLEGVLPEWPAATTDKQELLPVHGPHLTIDIE
ncbi:hypothetical protein GCM10020295_15980 [Streptomyces cinereospinus]